MKIVILFCMVLAVSCIQGVDPSEAQIKKFCGDGWTYTVYTDSITRNNLDSIIMIDGRWHCSDEVAEIINPVAREYDGKTYSVFEAYWVDSKLSTVSGVEYFGYRISGDTLYTIVVSREYGWPVKSKNVYVGVDK